MGTRKAAAFDAKLAAVACVIGAQLEHDRRVSNDFTSLLGDDLQYDINTITTFLWTVQKTLASGNPKYTFDFAPEFPAAALDLKLGEFIEQSNGYTTSKAARPRKGKPSRK